MFRRRFFSWANAMVAAISEGVVAFTEYATLGPGKQGWDSGVKASQELLATAAAIMAEEESSLQKSVKR